MRQILRLALLVLVQAILASAVASAQNSADSPQTTSAAEEDAVLSRVSTEALIKEYVSRRERAMMVFPPKLDPRGATTPSEVEKRLRQHTQDMIDFGRGTLQRAIVFSEGGYAPAQGIVANFSWSKNWGEVLGRDVCRALRYAFDAASGNNPVAMTILADAYRNGDGIKKDDKRAYFWARETMHRFWLHYWPPEYKIEDIVNSLSPEARAKLDREWMEWPQVKDIREQRAEVCK